MRTRAHLTIAAVLCVAAPALQAADAPAKTDAAAAKALPRLADGKPDFNGTWDNGSGIDFLSPQKHEDGSICVTGCKRPPPPPGAAPRPAPLPPDRPTYKPEFVAKVKELEEKQVEHDTVLRCRSPGLPRIGPPDKIVQIPGQIVFLYDDVSGAFWRVIPTDGRPHRTDVDESYLGDSVGRWEGDTLVIETVNFNEDTWLTDDGAFHTNKLKVTERLSRDGDRMQWIAIADDPDVLAEPWKVRPRAMKLTTQELVEPVPCVEQDLKHVVDGTHHDNPR